MRSIVSGAVFLCVAAASSAFGDYTLVSSSGATKLSTASATDPDGKWDWTYSSSMSKLALSGGIYALSGNVSATYIEITGNTTLTVSNCTCKASHSSAGVATLGGKAPGIWLHNNATLNIIIGEGNSTVAGYYTGNPTVDSSGKYTGMPGILVEHGSALAISEQEGLASSKRGKLIITAGRRAAGIGSCTNMVAGAITINSGNMIVNGGYNSPAIGAAVAGTGEATGVGAITINGGNLDLRPPTGMPTIGGGYPTGTVAIEGIYLNGGTISTTNRVFRIGVCHNTTEESTPANGITLSPVPSARDTAPLVFTPTSHTTATERYPKFTPEGISLRVEIPAGLAGGTYPLVSGLAAAPATENITITGREGAETIFTEAEGSEPSLLSIRVPDGGAGGTMILVF